MPHVTHVEGIVNDEDCFKNINYVYVGIFCGQYSPKRDYLMHANFMIDWEKDWIEPLRGKNLICDCGQHKDKCHAEILLQLANPPEQMELF